jgi:hypothetical protein
LGLYGLPRGNHSKPREKIHAILFEYRKLAGELVFTAAAFYGLYHVFWVLNPMTTPREAQVDQVDKDQIDEFARVIVEALDYTAREPILLLRMEEFFSPRPAKLANSKDEERTLKTRIDCLTEKLGGPPRLLILEADQQPNTYDTYAGAAIAEILHSFHRCRRSVCRTQLCLTGSEFYKSHPDVLNPQPEPAALKAMHNAMGEMFWEHAETSYIRLASFWDRIGQLLDYVFFNIRQYERDGFPSVMDRIRGNYVRLFPDFESGCWTRLWNYKKSEKFDGLNWLTSRRNLLVHSIHLEALLDAKANMIFNSAFNHLDDSARTKLKPETPELELDYLHGHLDAATRLFPDVLGLCELGVQLRE